MLRMSQGIDLALHAMWYLDFNSEQKLTLVRDIAAKQDISEAYLAKIMQQLVRAGLLISVRGRRGGFRLARPSGLITVGDVVRALEADSRAECNAELRSCPIGIENCAVLRLFDNAYAKGLEVLDNMTLKDLSEHPVFVRQGVEWIGKR